MRRTAKNLIPGFVWRAGRALWFAGLHARLLPSAALHPWRRDSIRKLAQYKDKHRGQRCFILGNGPSLNATDISKLEDEITFGMNRVYLAFEEWGFETSYFVSINDLVIQQSAPEIHNLDMPKFLSWHARKFISPSANTHFLHSTYTGPKFSKDVRGRLWEGATVTYVAMQLAFFMGFEQVVLIGVDHSFKTEGKPNTTVVSEGADPDHFSAGYFGKGFHWQLPDLETSEMAYEMARQAFASAGREILDATIGGQLTIFPKVNYDDLF